MCFAQLLFILLATTTVFNKGATVCMQHFKQGFAKF